MRFLLSQKNTEAAGAGCQASPTARGSSALVTVAGRFAELLHRTRIYPIPSPLAILLVLVLVLAHCTALHVHLRQIYGRRLTGGAVEEPIRSLDGLWVLRPARLMRSSLACTPPPLLLQQWAVY